MNSNPLLVVSDLHLGPAAPQGAADALAVLLRQYPERELVCLGDLFDLSTETQWARKTRGPSHPLAPYAELREAIRNHLVQGGRVTLVAGNHDAELATPGMRDKFLVGLELNAQTRLTIEPWWIHRGRIHLEHGHVWDPDNAPIHPLAPIDLQHEPLGVALTRRVLAPTGAFQLSHAHHTTPLAGLIRVLKELQFRAPEVILRYFLTGATLLGAASTKTPQRLRELGHLSEADFAHSRCVSPSLLAQLDAARPEPRHANARALFARLYLDRAIAALVATGALTSLATSRATTLPLLFSIASIGYLASSKRDRAYRYSGSLVARIEQAAMRVIELVDSDIVVFGHTHVEAAAKGYVNTGAFGFPGSKGRPYLLCDSDGSVHRGHIENETQYRVAPILLVS